MSKLQGLAITIGAAILFQLGGAFANTTTDDLTDIKSWAVGVGIGILNAIGVSIVAWKTTGGLSLEGGK